MDFRSNYTTPPGYAYAVDLPMCSRAWPFDRHTDISAQKRAPEGDRAPTQPRPGQTWRGRSFFLLECNFDDITTSLGENEECWLLAIKAAWEASSLHSMAMDDPLQPPLEMTETGIIVTRCQQYYDKGICSTPLRGSWSIPKHDIKSLDKRAPLRGSNCNAASQSLSLWRMKTPFWLNLSR